jgi:hypothetical protein
LWLIYWGIPKDKVYGNNAYLLQRTKESVWQKISCTVFQVDIPVWLLTFFQACIEANLGTVKVCFEPQWGHYKGKMGNKCQ